MLIPYHEPRDPAKLAALAESMGRDGWVGPPVVVDGEQALTGSHRIAAWRSLGRPDSEIPTIELSEVFVEAGLNMQECHEFWGRPTIDDSGFAQFIGELPRGIREKYGLEIR